MKREERLDWLCRLRSGLVWFDVPPKERPVFEQVLSEVIKSIEQEPCEDAVSREEVVKQLKEYWHDKYYQRTSIQEERDDFIRDVVSKLPSVTPTRKKGKWIEEVWNNKEHHTCSICQHIIDYEPCYHYCPNCGAEMESEE